MPVLLPFLVLLLLVLICRAHEPLWRQAILTAAVVWGVLVTGIIEVLSLFHALSTGWVATLWCLVILGLAFRYWDRLSTLERDSPLFRGEKEGQSPSSVFMLAGIGLIVSATAVIVLVAPPNTWDSMTYHMSRVENWIQNQSVAHYPTHMIPQLQRGPWAEIAVTHLQLLSHGDRFANLIQWLSMVGCVLGTSLIAKHLGSDARGQLFAAVLTATIPIGILEASSTQTDYAEAFWMVCFASFLLRLVQQATGAVPLPLPWLAGAGLGLAVLTKVTAYFYATPLVVWGAVALWVRRRSQAWRPLLLLCVMALLVNSGHYARNLDLFGSPIGPVVDVCAGCGYANETMSAGIFLSNVVRNIAIHLGTFSVTVNQATLRGIEALHRLLEVGANDPVRRGEGIDLGSFTLRAMKILTATSFICSSWPACSPSGSSTIGCGMPPACVRTSSASSPPSCSSAST